MRLTTLARIKRRAPVSTSVHDDLLNSLIVSVSHEVEAYLDRHLLLTSRTEQMDVNPGQQVWWLRGYPVSSSVSPTFKFDIDRAFTSDAEDSSTYYVRNEDGRVEFDFSYNTGRFRYPGALQVVYTGGLAATLDTFTSAISGLAGTFTASETVTGGTSGATGTYVSNTATSLTLRVTNGVFETGETVTGGTSAASATLGTFTATPLVMGYPDIVAAVDELVTMAFQRRDNVGLSSFSSEGSSISYWDTAIGWPKHAQALLERYRNLGRSR